MPRQTERHSVQPPSYHERHFGAVHHLFLDDRYQNWNETRKNVAYLVESRRSDAFMGLVISFNTVMVIMETDIEAKGNPVPRWIEIVSRLMIVIYTIEMLARLYAYRMYYWRNGWNIFDFVVVLSDLISELVNAFLLDVLPSTSFFKLFRLGRLFRFVCVLTMFEDLGKMISLMLSSLWTLLWGCFLIAAMVTCWSLVAVQFVYPEIVELVENGFYADCPRCSRAFSTVWQSNITFFQQLVFGDSWGTLCIPVIEHQPWTALVLVGAGACIQLGALNLILTVIVDKAHVQHELDAVHVLKAKAGKFLEAKAKLMKLCEALDKDADGQISKDEVKHGFYNDPEFAGVIGMLDFTAMDLDFIFGLLDQDGSGQLSCDEFCEELYKLQTQDERALLLHIKGNLNKVSQQRNQVKKGVELVKGDIEGMKDDLQRCSVAISDACMHLKHNSPTSSPTQDSFSCEDVPQLLVLAAHNIEKQIASAISKALKENGVLERLPVMNGGGGKRCAADRSEEESMSNIPELAKVLQEQMPTLRVMLANKVEELWLQKPCSAKTFSLRREGTGATDIASLRIEERSPLSRSVYSRGSL